MVEIVAEKLTVEYELIHEHETLTALWNINLTIPAGEFLVIVGPSGCGKTTFANCVVGLVEATQGRIFYDNKQINQSQNDVAMVFQDYALLPWRSVRKNVELGLELQGQLNKETQKRVDHYIHLVGLSAFEKNLPHELSGGMRQRVGLARALSIEPKVLILDEPFGALDAMTREVMQSELERILIPSHQTVIFITHSIDEAIVLGDRIVVMTAAPGQIKSILDVDIPRPRYDLDCRKLPRYHELREEIWHLLKSEQEKQMQYDSQG